ncbi:DUF2029 domain-containing protein [Candidatus Sumerlaeota bacterium]|nr:DUF2029 domain-containing protein [Candidatus Sumerlaeota bacterium]
MSDESGKMRQRIRILLGVMLAISLSLAAKVLIFHPLNTTGVDFDKHYYAAEAIVNGTSPYTSHGLYLSFNYPQFVAWINLPLLLFKNVDHAEKAWDIGNVILLFLTAFLVCKGYKPGTHQISGTPEELNLIDSHWWIPGLFLTFFFSPNTDGIIEGNISQWTLFSITLAGWAIVRKRDFSIGAWIAIASMIKVMPALLILPYITGRRGKVLAGAGIVWGIYLLILLITGTWGNEWFFITRVLPNIGEYWDHISYSVPYVALRYGSKRMYQDPGCLRLASLVWNLIWVISYIVVCLRYRENIKREKGDMLFLVMGMVLLPVLPPLLEFHHFVWSFPGLLITYHIFWKGIIPLRRIYPLFIGFLGLSAVGPFADVIYINNFSLVAFAPLFGICIYIFLILAAREIRD